jgi:hypothetical protein
VDDLLEQVHRQVIRNSACAAADARTICRS